jgi:hypothetical protein
MQTQLLCHLLHVIMPSVSLTQSSRANACHEILRKWSAARHILWLIHTGSTNDDVFNVTISFPDTQAPSTFQIPTNFGADTQLTFYPTGATFDGSSGECAKVCDSVTDIGVEVTGSDSILGMHPPVANLTNLLRRPCIKLPPAARCCGTAAAKAFSASVLQRHDRSVALATAGCVRLPAMRR